MNSLTLKDTEIFTRQDVVPVPSLILQESTRCRSFRSHASDNANLKHRHRQRDQKNLTFRSFPSQSPGGAGASKSPKILKAIFVRRARVELEE